MISSLGMPISCSLPVVVVEVFKFLGSQRLQAFALPQQIFLDVGPNPSGGFRV